MLDEADDAHARANREKHAIKRKKLSEESRESYLKRIQAADDRVMALYLEVQKLCDEVKYLLADRAYGGAYLEEVEEDLAGSDFLSEVAKWDLNSTNDTVRPDEPAE